MAKNQKFDDRNIQGPARFKRQIFPEKWPQNPRPRTPMRNFACELTIENNGVGNTDFVKNLILSKNQFLDCEENYRGYQALDE